MADGTRIDKPSLQDGYPPRVALRELQEQHPLPYIAPGTVDPASMGGEEPTQKALAALGRFNAALAADDAEKLASCFYDEQAYWRDQLALTYHLRTFYSPGVIAAGLLETKKLRGLTGELQLSGAAHFIPATPVLQFVDFDIVFRTSSPAATCRGRMTLLPVKTKLEDENETIEWKLWILSTMLENLDLHPEDETLLKSPGRNLDGLERIETDVFIIGGGNAAVSLAARLKALGVDSICAERNARVGDNWALRYDCMKFHIPTSSTDMAYMSYPKELRYPHMLTKDELAGQVRKYVAGFNLNVITSAKIKATQYDKPAKRWIVKFETPTGEHTAVSKHLVQATGIGSQKPYLPSIADGQLYKGISVHSAQYKNAKELRERGAKSVIIIGSANTAFDILEDCHAAGLKTTMNVRSPTYMTPVSYLTQKMSLGIYDDLGVAAGDRLFQTWPSVVDSLCGRGFFAHMASQEPERYAKLAAAGFPVLDSRLGQGTDLTHNLLERAGGHYVDVGGTRLLEEGECGVKANVEPVAFTETGLRFSDGSGVDVDAIVWCTGFADKNVRAVAAEILGGGQSAEDIASRLDDTWGLDEEGEIRGLWKRQLRVDNYWVMGGFTSHHRWHSRVLALQIKAELEGVLPPAYREIPEVKAR
ncbi:putative indole-3-pyruvate monooxygenase YUCCA10 [Cytospora mali]|uniref:Indole-3-pyruvate monooxygenase YUCCA10 n=1 Tax=Cytospora mali TaxID=578113 RepID=A0A194VUM0_CYTMA|nr:putative indole-3-pyruvate monooxygenase YUCCA10 [Valsa mali]